MIPLYKPYMPEELPELNKILHSGALAYGKWGRAFESKIAEFISNEKVLVVNSYNAAALVALTAMGINSGDEVIASPMSCLASNQPIVTQGAKIIWADIDPSTGTLDPNSVKSKITSKTKVIFHNHHCGYPGYINEINAMAKAHGLYVVDDAIEAFGTEYNNKKIGNLGTDITLFSFQTVRLPNAIDGGGLSFNNEELFKKALKIRDLGVDRSIFRDQTGEISKECDISLPGFGATMSEINSYIGCIQMNDIEQLLTRQSHNGRKWIEIIQDKYPEINLLRFSENVVPNYWVFGMLVPDKLKYINLFREQGFYASGVHLNNNEYSVFKNHEMLPGTQDFYNKFIALPSGWWTQI
jgi:dTDP-4-amino-4,6-dideoxygalactose transaminase